MRKSKNDNYTRNSGTKFYKMCSVNTMYHQRRRCLLVAFSANHSLNSLNSSFLRPAENQLASDAAVRLRMRDERCAHGFWDAVHVDEVIINVDVVSDYAIRTAVLVVMLDSLQQSVSFFFCSVDLHA